MAYVSNASKKTLQEIAGKIVSKAGFPQEVVKSVIIGDSQTYIGVGDPSLIAITNVNAQIAAGTRVEPMNQKMQRQITLEQGNEKEKEQVYQQDKNQMTIDEIQELGDDVYLGVPPDAIYGPQPTEQLQQQLTLVQQDIQQQQIEDLQAQQMTDMNRAMNYKLGSMDWGKNPVNVSQFPSREISMRINDKTPSYVLMNKVLTKQEKVNQAKLKKNYISEEQMNQQIE
ncbi:MAG: hypothetical protein EZS28_029053, partial [Streblomastix strix]